MHFKHRDGEGQRAEQEFERSEVVGTASGHVQRQAVVLVLLMFLIVLQQSELIGAGIA